MSITEEKKEIAAKEKREIQSREELRKELLNLPDETERIYEKRCMNMSMQLEKADFEKWANLMIEQGDTISSWDIEQVKNLLRKAGVRPEKEFNTWIEELLALPEDGTEETEKIAFAAFCVRMGHLRRLKDTTAQMSEMQKYESRFQKTHPFFDHLKAMCLIDDGVLKNEDQILKLARNNIKKMPENAGVRHVLAIAVADILEEKDFWSGGKLSKIEQAARDALLQEALREANLALEVDDYAKFHSTRGRLLALDGKTNEALKELTMAIDKEDSTKADYAMRIGAYRAQIQNIRERKSMQTLNTYLDDVKNKQIEMEKEADRSMAKNMEFLGLFAGIVSFTIGGISIATSMSAREAAGVIIVLMGALMAVFAGFGMILHGFATRKCVRNVVVLTLGCLIAYMGVQLCS